MCEKVIYEIKNKINGKKYIGSTKDKEKRWQVHRNKLEKNKHYNSHLQNAWNKYGSNEFEFSVLEEVENEDVLVDREQDYLDSQKPEYNIALDAKAPTRGRKMSKERNKKISESLQGKQLSKQHREKLSEVHSGENNWQYGIPKEEHPFYGRELTEEHKQKISESLKGKNSPWYNKNLSEEHKEKLSKAKSGENHPFYGKHRSEEVKQKIGDANRGENSGRAKLTEKKVKIIKYLLKGNSFIQKEIGKMFGVSDSIICMINTGKIWTHVTV